MSIVRGILDGLKAYLPDWPEWCVKLRAAMMCYVCVVLVVTHILVSETFCKNIRSQITRD